MKNALKWVKSLFADERGEVSSKRLVGIMCAIFLCLTLYQNSFTEEQIAPSVPLVQMVAALAFGCLGLSSLDKLSFLKHKKDDEPKQTD